MQASTRRAPSRNQFDLFRAIECAREARFDVSHTKRLPQQPVFPANRARANGLGA